MPITENDIALVTKEEFESHAENRDPAVLHVTPEEKTAWNDRIDQRTFYDHTMSETLDHPDGSVTRDKIADRAVDEDKLSDALKEKIDSAARQADAKPASSFNLSGVDIVNGEPAGGITHPVREGDGYRFTGFLWTARFFRARDAVDLEFTGDGSPDEDTLVVVNDETYSVAQHGQTLNLENVTLTGPVEVRGTMFASVLVKAVVHESAAVHGLMSAADKEKSDKYASDIADSPFNTAGSRALKITGFSGVHGGSGYYTVEGDAAMASEIRGAVGCAYTLYNVMNADGFGHIAGAAFVDGEVCVSVDTLYTNARGDSYDPDGDQSASGAPFAAYPELGYSIKSRDMGVDDYAEEAYLIIHGFPEIGTVKLNRNAAAFGLDNHAQGPYAFAHGLSNRASGKYATAFGKQNKAGYDCHVFGRSIDAENQQESFAAGFGHTLYGFGNRNAVFGERNTAAYSHQLIAGKYNRNKETNLMEIGDLSANRRNAFEVDTQGRVAANEVYLPGQLVAAGQKTFNDYEAADLITVSPTGDYDGQLRVAPIGMWNGRVRLTNAYGPYVMVNRERLSLATGSWYLLRVTFTNYIDGWKPTIRAVFRENGADKAGTVFIGGPTGELPILKSGQYTVTFPLYVTDTYSHFGFYVDRNTSELSIDGISLYRTAQIAFDAGVDGHTVHSLSSVDADVLNCSSNRAKYVYADGLRAASLENGRPYLLFDAQTDKLYASACGAQPGVWNYRVYSSDLMNDQTLYRLKAVESMIAVMNEVN